MQKGNESKSLKKVVSLSILCILAISFAFIPATPARAAGGTTLTAGFLIDVTSINPVNWFTISDLNVLQLIYNTLVQVNSSGLPAPGLATSWTISPDGKTYTFTIVSGAQWQDGQPISANDVAFTFGYWKQYQLPYGAALAGAVATATATDAQHVVVTLKHPDPGFLLGLADLGLIVPQHIWSTITSPKNSTNLVGSGPFSFVSRTPGVSIVLKANPNFFKGAPKYDNLVIKIYSSVDSANADLQAGTLNLVQLPEGQNLAPLQANSNINIVQTPSTMIYYITMNTQTFPFNDVLVRRAIAYAVDRGQVLSLAFQSQGQVANSVLSTSLSYFYNSNVVTYNYDANKAVALLRQDGYSNSTGKWLKNGQELTFTDEIINQAPWVQIATVIQQELGSIGITVTTKALDSSTVFGDVIGTHNYQMDVLSWRLYFDPLLFIEPSFHSTESGPNGIDFSVFRNSTVDALINQAGNATSLSAERDAVFKIQADLSNQVPWIMLAYGADIWAVQGYVGWRPVPRYGLWYYDTFENLAPLATGTSTTTSTTTATTTATSTTSIIQTTTSTTSIVSTTALTQTQTQTQTVTSSTIQTSTVAAPSTGIDPTIFGAVVAALIIILLIVAAVGLRRRRTT